MTRTDMLQRVRAFLDESSEGFYLDDEEIYPALALAQIEVANALIKAWMAKGGRQSAQPLPAPLIDLKVLQSGNTALSAVAISGVNILEIISVRFALNSTTATDLKPSIVMSEAQETQFIRSHPLLSGGYTCDFTRAVVNLFPEPALSSAYRIEYIGEPADITASVDPTIGVEAHDALCARALWLLLKDDRPTSAQTHLTVYTQLLQGLM